MSWIRTSALSSYLQPSPKRTPSWCNSWKGPLRRMPTSVRQGYFRSPPSGAPSWCLSRDAPHTPYYLSTPTSTPAVSCTEPRRPQLSPAVSYKNIELVQLPGGAPASPAYVGPSRLPPAASFLGTQLVPLFKGTSLPTPYYLRVPISPPAVSFPGTMLMHLP